MILKVGLLVLCQFYWATETLTPKDGQKAPAPHQVVGKIKNIYPAKKEKALYKDGSYVSTSSDSTLIELESRGTALDYFIEASACVPVKTAAQAKKDEEAKAQEETKPVSKTLQKTKELKKQEVVEEKEASEQEKDVKDTVAATPPDEVKAQEEKVEPTTEPVSSPTPEETATPVAETTPSPTPTPTESSEEKVEPQSKSMIKGIINDIFNQK
jgi:hypothetical protein